MDFSQLFNVSQLAKALALASLLSILSSGLALIFGLRDVINFGHGALIMLGTYLGYSAAQFNFWAALLLVPLLLAGVVFELACLRPRAKSSTAAAPRTSTASSTCLHWRSNLSNFVSNGPASPLPLRWDEHQKSVSIKRWP